MELFEIKEELENKRNILSNVVGAITHMTKAMDVIAEIEEKLTPGIFGHLDGDLYILENLKLELETQIENLEEEKEYVLNNPRWREERRQQEKEYWSTQF